MDPSQILHFFNTPPGMSEDQLLNAFTSKDCLPSQVRMFPLKSERSSSGLVEFPSVALAVNAIMKCNHSAIDHKGKSNAGKLKQLICITAINAKGRSHCTYICELYI